MNNLWGDLEWVGKNNDRVTMFNLERDLISYGAMYMYRLQVGSRTREVLA